MSAAADSSRTSPDQPDPVLIVGHGLAGLVAAYELAQRGVPSTVIDQENAANVGGQAFWSLGGIFCVDSADQRRYGVKDSRTLALRDWLGSAQFDRLDGDDRWPRRWAEAFVDFAHDEMEGYLKGLGLSFLNVGWAERGDGTAEGHGNSVPRFHLTWGTGPEVVRIFREPVERAAQEGLVTFRHRHMVDKILVDEATGRAIGVKGRTLEEDDSPRGVKSDRTGTGDFELFGSAVLVASGGIGGDLDLVKKHWPARLGPKVPQSFVVGVPAHVDGRMIDITQEAGANVINRDRMWHYTEGLQNWKPIWPHHGIRVLPAPSSLWLDATGKRLPPHLYPGADTLGTLKYICSTGYDYTWFITDQAIVAKEFALSGSEQNPDVTNKSYWQVFKYRVLGTKGTPPVQDFYNKGTDFVVRDSLADLVEGMNELVAKTGGDVELDYEQIKEVVEARDGQFDNPYSKDAQAMLASTARSWPCA
ncbi:hypothetical protein P8C59_005929 [Phyllachora maydis]|uniref:FAD-dependent oxidoreductase 2 FAD-binding domain-containing protein n=1 Tax=Phyllachora maydis TaxID=1825666 RepID=A0AAD9I5H4_9PEZI|nr:hypothetical protein P8C59_005929 [Phyllachora maydis]